MTDAAVTRVELDDLIRLQAEARLLRIPDTRGASAQQMGRHGAMYHGRGMEFAEVRLYQPGDDIRAIDWRVTARRSQPHTKLFQEERERPVLLVCDQGPSLYFGSERAYKRVAAAECAAILAWLALFKGDRVGGVLFSQERIELLRPVRRRRSVMRLLDLLSQLEQPLDTETLDHSHSRLNEALVETRRIAHTGSRVYVISDFMHTDDRTPKLLAQLARHNRVTAIRIVDRFERELPPPGQYAVGSGDDTLWLDTANPAFRDAFEARVLAHEAQLQSLFRTAGIHCLTLSTGEHPGTALRRLPN